MNQKNLAGGDYYRVVTIHFFFLLFWSETFLLEPEKGLNKKSMTDMTFDGIASVIIEREFRNKRVSEAEAADLMDPLSHEKFQLYWAKMALHIILDAGALFLEVLKITETGNMRPLHKKLGF